MAIPYRIREGMVDDLDELHRLMQESRTNGTNEASFTPSVETLRTYGFTEPTYFQFFVAVNSADQGDAGACGENPSLVGYLFFCQSFSSEVGKIINLKDLYVTPGFRRKGAAKEMWKAILKFAMAGEFQRVQLLTKNDDPELLQYLQNYGLIDLIQKEGWRVFNMKKTAIQAVK